MSFNYLTPVKEDLLNQINTSSHALKNKMLIHSEEFGFPDLSNVKIAIIGVPENRNEISYPDKYVDWFLPISEELFRVLKPSGTFVLNIKEKVVKGERSTYVIELILGIRFF